MFATPPRIKVCCIGSVEEARLAIQAGASALGLVSAMPSGPGVIEEALIVEIAKSVPPPIATFLLTSEQSVDRIIAQQRRCGVNTVQLCDRLTGGTHEQLRRGMPGINLVQVVHVNGRESVEEAVAVEPHVDAILLDSGNRSLAVKELGGTGRTHDWRISRQIRESITKPLFLAGGLRADNVIEAIQAVEPFGIDVCSGVRTDGVLDREKLRRFVAAVAGYNSTEAVR
jgi:phosphoribosylanthranilate isomerase